MREKKPIDYDGARPIFYRSSPHRAPHDVAPLTLEEFEELDQRYHMSEHGHRSGIDPDDEMSRLFATAAQVFQPIEGPK